MIDLHQLEFISITLTPFVLVACGLVLVHYGPQAFYFFRMNGLSHMTAEQCLIAGIAIGFAGKLMDNAYWAIPWMGDFLGADNAGEWFRHGIVPNIPFRQLACIASAGFHVLAACRYAGRRSDLMQTTAFLSALVIGYLTVVYLLLVLPHVALP